PVDLADLAGQAQELDGQGGALVEAAPRADRSGVCIDAGTTGWTRRPEGSHAAVRRLRRPGRYIGASAGATTVHRAVTPRLYRPLMGLPIPQTLSPSSMGCFTSCPLAFRFSYVQRLPEPPSAPASKGTLVHLALQHLMWRPAHERTIENGLLDLARAVSEVSADPEFAHLDLTEAEWSQFHSEAEVLLRRYFEIEDPTQITVLGP